MEPEIKRELEEMLEKTKAFLRREKQRSDFEAEDEFGAFALGVGFGISYIREMNESDRERELKGFGYTSIEELERDYRKAVDHYSPIFGGNPIDVDRILKSVQN